MTLAKVLQDVSISPASLCSAYVYICARIHRIRPVVAAWSPANAHLYCASGFSALSFLAVTKREWFPRPAFPVHSLPTLFVFWRTEKAGSGRAIAELWGYSWFPGDWQEHSGDSGSQSSALGCLQRLFSRLSCGALGSHAKRYSSRPTVLLQQTSSVQLAVAVGGLHPDDALARACERAYNICKM